MDWPLGLQIIQQSTVAIVIGPWLKVVAMNGFQPFVAQISLLPDLRCRSHHAATGHCCPSLVFFPKCYLLSPSFLSTNHLPQLPITDVHHLLFFSWHSSSLICLRNSLRCWEPPSINPIYHSSTATHPSSPLSLLETPTLAHSPTDCCCHPEHHRLLPAPQMIHNASQHHHRYKK